MNVVDLIEAARPEVGPMPQAERRMVRERLFGAADEAARTTIRERSQSGAVTSTAPPGYRARRVKARPSRPRSTGSLAKMGAGLLVLGAAAAAGWSWYADGGDDDDPALVSASTVVTSTTTTTTPPTTTTEPATRTGVSESEPVVFPLGLVPVEEAVIELAALDDQFVLLRAADGTWIRLDAEDGGVADYSALEFTTVGSVDVSPIAFGPGQPWIYVFRVGCGAVRVVDGPGQERLRPLMTELFEGMSIDAGGTIDALLPDGLRIIESASGNREYRTVFRFEADDDDGDDTLVTLRQIPDGSLAQLVPGGAQLAEMVWLGEAALGTGDLDPDDDESGAVTVFWRDADTVFSIGSETMPLEELETFVSGLRAVSIDDWVDRFSAEEIDTTITLGTNPDDGDDDADADESAAPTCAPQPNLGPTFLP